jgi:hypothetical protein
MRKMVLLAAGAAILVSGCARQTGLNRVRPDEFAVARQPPLAIPPDFALVPPQPGAARVQTNTGQDQTLQALFGANTQRSASEAATLDEAGASDPGIRSAVGDTGTNVVDKGSTTRDVVAAPEGDGQDAKTSTPQ